MRREEEKDDVAQWAACGNSPPCRNIVGAFRMTSSQRLTTGSMSIESHRVNSIKDRFTLKRTLFYLCQSQATGENIYIVVLEPQSFAMNLTKIITTGRISKSLQKFVAKYQTPSQNYTTQKSR